jgi:hypothetical protein
MWFFTHPVAIAVLPLAGLAGIPALLWLVDRLKARRAVWLEVASEARFFLIALWIASVVKISYYAVFEPYFYNARYWYYVPEALILVITSAAFLAVLGQQVFLSGPSRAAQTAAFGGMAIAALFIANAQPAFEWELATFRALPELSRRLPPDARVGARDAGLLGYLRPNPVLNLDGLANDDTFFEYLRSARVAEYIRKEDIRYLVNLAEPGAQDLMTHWFEDPDLELLYRSSDPVEVPPGWVYKLYRVRPGAH